MLKYDNQRSNYCDHHMFSKLLGSLRSQKSAVYNTIRTLDSKLISIVNNLQFIEWNKAVATLSES